MRVNLAAISGLGSIGAMTHSTGKLSFQHMSFLNAGALARIRWCNDPFDRSQPHPGPLALAGGWRSVWAPRWVYSMLSDVDADPEWEIAPKPTGRFLSLFGG